MFQLIAILLSSSGIPLSEAAAAKEEDDAFSQHLDQRGRRGTD